MRLHVINGIKKEKPNYYLAYLNYFLKMAHSIEARGSNLINIDMMDKKRLIFAGVKIVNLSRYEDKTDKEKEASRQLAFATKGLMAYLTPNDLENIFPIDKDYDGDRFGVKDYFFTKKTIRGIGEDNLIGENIDKLLWDYQNSQLRTFTVNLMSIIDDIRRSDGEKGLLEKIFEEKGLPTYTMHEGEKGKVTLTNNLTGETTEAKKRIPRYLKLV